jgi:hypothetical protein
MRGHAGLRVGVAVDDHRAQPVDEVELAFRRGARVPAQRVGRALDARRRAGLPVRQLDAL